MPEVLKSPAYENISGDNLTEKQNFKDYYKQKTRQIN